MKLNDIQTKFKDIKTVNFTEAYPGMVFAEVTASYATAVVSLYGAHVMSYSPKEQEDLLWMSGHSYYEVGQPLRGGIPVCWPWFGAHPQDESKPSHGIARISDWELAEIIEGNDSVALVLKLTDNESTLNQWPHQFDLTYKVTIGKELKIELITSNTGNQSFEFAEALHTYFNISNITDIFIDGFDGSVYSDRLTDQDITQSGSITFNAETDRIYSNPLQEAIINDPGKSRKISNTRINSASAVVWNPWIEKSKKMPDFGADEYPGMVCVETANVADKTIKLEPQASHSVSAVIKSI